MLIDIGPYRRQLVLDPTPRHTPIFASLMTETATAIKCHHARRDDLNVCLDCGFCPHARIYREEGGTSREVQVCEGCGEERHPGRDSF